MANLVKLQKIFLVVLLILSSIFLGQSITAMESDNDQYAVTINRVVDADSLLEYCCFPCSIFASKSKDECWDCVDVSPYSNGTFKLKFFRRGWHGKKVLPKDIKQLTSKLIFDIFNSTEKQNTIILEDFMVEGSTNKVDFLKFSCIFQQSKYEFIFSYTNKTINLIDIMGKKKQLFNITEGNYNIAQVLGLGISILMEKLIY